MFIALSALTRQSAEFGVKNYLGACTQGVFSNKVRIAHCEKALKVFFMFLFLKTLNYLKSLSKSSCETVFGSTFTIP